MLSRTPSTSPSSSCSARSAKATPRPDPRSFCHTADEAITPHHVPRLCGLDDTDLHTQLAAHIVPFAHKAWADLQHPDDGAVRLDHDHYLKIWALTRPRIDADFLLLDEAQDTNPVVEQIFLAQRDHAQLVMVGDSAQAIYHWRGAKDIMTGFDGTQLALSQSFRFGPDLAAEANRWLHLADAPIRLTGTPAVPTELGLVTQPDAVLCRTNVGAMAQVMARMAAGHRVALAGEGTACTPWPSRPATSRKAAAPTIPNCSSFPAGAICRTTPPTILRAGTSSPWSTSSTPTAQTPSSPPSPNSPPNRTHTSPSPPPTRPRDANGPASSSPRTSPVPSTTPPARREARRHPSPTPSMMLRPVSPTSPSPALADVSTWEASPGSTTTRTAPRRARPALMMTGRGHDEVICRQEPARKQLNRGDTPTPRPGWAAIGGFF